MTDTPNFARPFAAAFGAQDAAGLAALFTSEGSFHSLTGRFFEGSAAIEAGMEEEFAGLSRMARLVTGRGTQQALAASGVILHQRFVVTGLRDASGAEIPRMGALLTAVLERNATGWQARTATFAVLES